MKRNKDVFSKAFSEFTFSDSKIKFLHQVLFGMLLDIKEVCEKNHITILLSGGTMLGAVRHQGFIPWDDDLDVMMFRSEYVKLREVFQKELGEKYELVEPLQGNYTNKKPKIYLKNSIFSEVLYAGLPSEYRRVFIDVFLIENVPASIFARKIIGVIYDFAFHASGFIADYKYPSPIILEKAKSDHEVMQYYSFRRKIGKVLNVFFGMRFYIWICVHIDHCKRESGWVAVPSAISYNREVFKKEIFADLMDAEFNGELFKIPTDYDRYLKNLYHDYMKLPPEMDRLVHSVTEFKLLAEEDYYE